MSDLVLIPRMILSSLRKLLWYDCLTGNTEKCFDLDGNLRCRKLMSMCLCYTAAHKQVTDEANVEVTETESCHLGYNSSASSFFDPELDISS